MELGGFERLLVWQEAKMLGVSVYRIVNELPRHELLGLGSQMRRAAGSIMANIAEGHGRQTTKEFIRFLYIARGSLMELRSHLILAVEVGYLDAIKATLIQRQADVVGRMLNKLVASLEKSASNGLHVKEQASLEDEYLNPTNN